MVSSVTFDCRVRAGPEKHLLNFGFTKKHSLFLMHNHGEFHHRYDEGMADNLCISKKIKSLGSVTEPFSSKSVKIVNKVG